jgi:hypothetical protein
LSGRGVIEAGAWPSGSNVDGVWFPVATSDWRLRELRDRHYAGGVGGKTAGPPGRRLAFVTFAGEAGWISHWPYRHLSGHGQGDCFVCSLFRNEGDWLSSQLIEAAIALTVERWGEPPDGWLTFVDADQVRSPNPGYCFKRAGFRHVGYSSDRQLHVLR